MGVEIENAQRRKPNAERQSQKKAIKHQTSNLKHLASLVSPALAAQEKPP
jgi:hypothetical protein